MRLFRIMAVLMIGLLLGWGGFAVPGAAVAGLPHHAAAPVAADDCDRHADQHGASGHQDRHHEEPSKTPHQECCVTACVMACGLSAVEPAAAPAASLAHRPLRVPAVADDALHDRPVSPLRRPPRSLA